MPSPAGRPQRPRTVIQWHDEGRKPRVRHFLPDDASPYRALLLAGTMAVVSAAAVVAAIQYQRHGSLPEMGALVESAAASPEAAPKTALTTEPRTEEVKPVQASVVMRPASRPAAASSAIGSADAPDTSAKTARIDTSQSIALSDRKEQPSETLQRELDPSENPALFGSLAADRAQQEASPVAALEQFETSGGEQDPQTSATGKVLAFASSEEAPASPPLPQAAPRDKKLALVQKPEEPEADQTGENASVRSAVNLRAGPSDGAKVLLTIPRGAKIKLGGDCRHWCPVTYDGRTGFVYKTFIRR